MLSMRCSEKNNFATHKGCPAGMGQPFHVAAEWAARLRAIDYDALPISNYNKRYIRAIRPAMDYYMEIFARCLHLGMPGAGPEPAAVTVVDYGGGCGFLSILAKGMGFGQVIYVDLNPLSVETMKVLKRQTGTGPDVILQGSADVLAAYCRTHAISPHLLIATDLIEHVYDPAALFAALCTINHKMQMIFTTASTPFNPLVKRRLHRFMKGCESGAEISPGYRSRREAFIRWHYPHFSSEQILLWSRRTRGLVYGDIRKAIADGSLPLPADAHNTCDPETGNWAERILPMRDYRALLSPYGYTLSVDKGFYNTRRRSLPASLCCRFLNVVIRHSGRAGLLLSPFIVLWCRPPVR
jgi:2-polyprenyl-3-methyl-5-hydroxy-6-metoxy-1,4-benzoquinol methylase